MQEVIYEGVREGARKLGLWVVGCGLYGGLDWGIDEKDM